MTIFAHKLRHCWQYVICFYLKFQIRHVEKVDIVDYNDDENEIDKEAAE